MSSDLFPLQMALGFACVFALALLTPWGRRGFTNMLVHARILYIERPLRVITGRRRPDYAAIRRLEREELGR